MYKLFWHSNAILQVVQAEGATSQANQELWQCWHWDLRHPVNVLLQGLEPRAPTAAAAAAAAVSFAGWATRWGWHIWGGGANPTWAWWLSEINVWGMQHWLDILTLPRGAGHCLALRSQTSCGMESMWPWRQMLQWHPLTMMRMQQKWIYNKCWHGSNCQFVSLCSARWVCCHKEIPLPCLSWMCYCTILVHLCCESFTEMFIGAATFTMGAYSNRMLFEQKRRRSAYSASILR